MMLWHLIRNDFKFQWRHGIQSAYGAVIFIYALAIHLLPLSIRNGLVAGLLYTDVTVFGFFFIGGIILLEKSQDVHAPLFMTPVPPTYFIYSKVITMVLNSMGFGCLLIFLSRITPVHWTVTLLSLLLMSTLFTIMGLLIALRARHINHYFILAVPVNMLCIAPLALMLLPRARPWLWLNAVAGGWQLTAAGILGQPAPLLPATMVILLTTAFIGRLAYRWLVTILISGRKSL